MRNVKCSDCDEYRNEWCKKVKDSPHPDLVRDCQYWHERKSLDDLISRQAAIDYFVTNVGFHDEDGYPIEDSDELRKIWTEYFDGIPSAQPEPYQEGEQNG